jgi:hypothetical protein
LEEKEMTEITKLKKIAVLAYDKVFSEIYHYWGWLIGSFIGIALMFVFTISNGALLSNDHKYAIVLSVAYAFVQSCIIMLELCIFLSLLMYSFAIIYVCYIYDNRSWVIINAPLKFVRDTFTKDPDIRKREYEEGKKLSEARKKEFDAEVFAIRDAKDSSFCATED